MKRPISNPMSFWTDQDVLAYIKLYGKEMVAFKEKSSSVYMRYGNRFVSRKTGATMGNNEIENAICSVYGDIVTDYGAMGQVDGQISMADCGIFDLERPLLKTTGCDRTGCMFCGYGCHLEKSPGRFERMKITHPKIYDYIMKPWSEGGLGYKEIIDWINKNGNLNIKY